MATLTVNEHELRIIGRAGWGPLIHESGRRLPAYIEALVDTSRVSEGVLNQVNATVRLTTSDGMFEGTSMVQIGRCPPKGYGTFMRFEGQEVERVG